MRRFLRRTLTPFRMMALGGLLPGLAALLLFWNVRPGGVVLQWHFAKDRPFIEETLIETDQRTKIAGMAADMTENVTLTFQWMPREQDPIRNWVIDRRLHRVIVRNSGEENVIYDSANPLTAQTPHADMYKDFIGTKSTLTVGPHSRALLIEIPRVGPQSLETEQLPDLQKQLAEYVMLWTPPQPVRPGDTWEDERELPMGLMGSFHARCRFTYLGMDKHLDKISMEMDLEYRPASPAKATAGAQAVRFKSGKLGAEPGAGGTAWFDRGRGRLDHAEITMHLKGKLTLEVAGSGDAEMEMDTPTKTTIKIRDMDKPPPRP